MKRVKMGHLLRNTACPECSQTGRGMSLSIYDDGEYCHECGYSSKEVDEMNRKEIPKREKKKLPLIPIGQYLPIKSRAISKEVCEKYHYSWADYEGTVVQCVSFYKEGRIVTQKLRFKDKRFRWLGDASQAPTLYGMEDYEPNPKLSITVTEGELDRLCWINYTNDKWPVVGLLNGAGKQGINDFAKSLEFLSGYKKVIIMFDGDEAGRYAAEECAKLLPGKAKIVKMPDGKDVCDMIKEDRGLELEQLEVRASSYKPKDIVSIDDYTKEELYSKETRGVPLPYPKLSNMMRGLKKGRLYTFCAGSGLGKSTIVKEIAYHLMFNENIKVGSIFLEQEDREAMRDYIAMHCNIEAESFSEAPENAKEALKDEAWDILSTNAMFYKHFGSLDTDTLLHKIEYLMVGCDCEYVILDHISMVVSGINESGNERKDIDMLMTKLRALIQRTNKSVLGVVHLKRPSESRGSFTNGAQVLLSDLRGSASLEQISDFVIALERDQFDEEQGNITKIKILKSRRGGKVGYCDAAVYNDKTGRLLPAGEISDEG